MQKALGKHLLSFHCISVWLEGKHRYFLKEHVLKLKAQATLLPKNKGTSPQVTTQYWSHWQCRPHQLCHWPEPFYDSLDTIICIAVHYALLPLNWLFRIQPNEKGAEKKKATWFNYITFKGNSNSLGNLNAILKCF